MPKIVATVFHATDADPFEAFDPAFQKDWKFGFWFSVDREFTTIFGKNVCEAKITLKKPKTITQERWNAIRDKHARDHEWFFRWRCQLQEKGYDGLRVLEDVFRTSNGIEFKDHEVLAVFDPKTIEIIGWTPKKKAEMEQPDLIS